MAKRGRPKGSGIRTAPNTDDLAMKARYEAGETLDAIGKTYGITRERVRQRLTRWFGFDATSGGHSLTAAAMKVKRTAARDRRYRLKWGHSYAEHKEFLSLGWPIRAFRNQKGTACSRGIAWQMTFQQWWDIWQASGRWGERGRGHGYVMCRYGDSGPYSPDNVYIASGTENIRHYHDRRSGVHHEYSIGRDGVSA